MLIFSCNPQESNAYKKENPNLKIEYNFYPSSGGEPIYRVLYFDEEVVVENLEHPHTYKGKITKDKIEENEQISKIEIKRIVKLSEKIKKSPMISLEDFGKEMGF